MALRNLLAAFAAIFVTFVSPVSAGNSPDLVCDACDMFRTLQQQTPRYVAPTPVYRQAPVHVSAPSGGQVCVWALNAQPTALVLRNGSNNTGSGLVGWNASGWQQTGRGYMKQVCFSDSLLSGRSAVTLCGDVGHSTWRQSEIQQLITYRSISQSDPACVGGSSWCRQRGL